MEWDLQKASGRTWKDYLPGGGIISTLGWDAYPQGSATNQNPQPTPPTDFMGPAIAASKSVGLPFGFAEFALSTPVGRPAWLTSVGNYIMSSGAVLATLFNGNAQYPTERLTQPADISVWRSFVARSGSGAPAPAPTGPVTPGPTPTTAPPSSSGLSISNLALGPATFAGSGDNHANITFTVSQGSDITICVLGSDGTIERQIAKPSHASGKVTIPYYGYSTGGHRLIAGSYPILVVASNSTGSATAEATLTIGAP